MIIYTVHFGRVYGLLAEALARSVTRNCPDALFIPETIPTPPQELGVIHHVTRNSAKLAAWTAMVKSVVLENTDMPMVLMDADTVVLRDLAPAFEADFDVAYTTRPGRLPINGGVVFARATQATGMFFDQWLSLNDEIATDPTDCTVGVRKYGGVNQAALGVLLERGAEDVRLQELPCAIWNSCETTWADFDPELTAIMHVKSRLRRAVFTGSVPREGPNTDLAHIVETVLPYMRR